MPRQFNTAGPCKADIHYMLPPTRRLHGVRDLVEARQYFVLHGARQVGKTTALLSLGQELTAEGKFAAVLVSCEAGVPFEDLERAVPAILGGWGARARAFLPPELRPPSWPVSVLTTAIQAAIEAWCLACPRPLVLFLDEVDGLAPDVLGSLLRQLRDGHANRPQGFPWSLALVGMRDIKDYVITSGGTGRSGAGSPFNVSAGSLTMGNFTHADIAELYAQHTGDTGQAFEPAAVDRVWELTAGQPWLVNALAREATSVLCRDWAAPVRLADIDQARRHLVQRMDTHLDSLVERLRDPRVRRVMEPLIAGLPTGDLPSDDIRYVTEMGLVVLTDSGLTVANPIYREIIPNGLATTIQAFFPQWRPSWVKPDGTIDLDLLLAGFLAFWKKDGVAMMGAAAYPEIAAHTVLMAWLTKVCNGGGFLDREYANGDGRMDLFLRAGGLKLGIEVKVWRDYEPEPAVVADGTRKGRAARPKPRPRPDPLIEGIPQLDGYLSKVGAADGWLVIFEHRAGMLPIEKRTSASSLTSPAGHKVVVVRG